VARALLLGAAIVWLIAGAVGIGIGLMGAADLQRILPNLAIDLAALGGAVVAVGSAILAVGVLHAAVIVGLRLGNRLARTVGLLLSATLFALLVTLAAAAVTTAVTVPEGAPPFLAAGLVALVGAAVYGFVTARLVAEVRASRAR
jgi:hypothetical protein